MRTKKQLETKLHGRNLIKWINTWASPHTRKIVKIVIKVVDWFGLVSLFNGISTLFRLLNAKAILLEEQ